MSISDPIPSGLTAATFRTRRLPRTSGGVQDVAGLVTIDPVSGSPPVQARRSATSSPGLAAHGGI